MNRLLLILILIFNFQSWTKADDIKDFEIEGMSINKSALYFMTVDEIVNNTLPYFETKRKYYITGIVNNLKLYDQVEIYLKSNDDKYYIKTIIAAIFIDIEPLTYNDVAHTFDKSGKTKQYQTAFLLKNHRAKDHIRIECTKWSKKMKKENGFADNLGVSVFSTETLEWVDKGYQ